MKNIQYKKHWWYGVMLAISFLVFFSTTQIIRAQTSGDEVIHLTGYAWGAASEPDSDSDPAQGSGLGWIYFPPEEGYEYGVDIIDNMIEGDAYSPTLGFLQFGGLSGFPSEESEYCGSGDCNAHIEEENGREIVYGWARLRSNQGDGSDYDGWIALHGPNYEIEKQTNSEGLVALVGYAWGSSDANGTSDGYGYGPGWIRFPEPTDDCTIPPGVCGGVGFRETEFSCSGSLDSTEEDGYHVTWTVFPPDDEEYEYYFDDGGEHTQSVTESTYSVVYEKDSGVSSVAMEVTPSGESLEGDQDVVTCEPVDLEPQIVENRIVPIELWLQKTPTSAKVKELTVSKGENYYIFADLGGTEGYNPESCSVFGVGSVDGRSDALEGLASKTHTLSCSEAGINDVPLLEEEGPGDPTTASVLLRVIGDGLFEEE